MKIKEKVMKKIWNEYKKDNFLSKEEWWEVRMALDLTLIEVIKIIDKEFLEAEKDVPDKIVASLMYLNKTIKDKITGDLE